MNNRIPVLIVGAGPTGLMMACELARYGVPFRIVDKKPERTLTANAAGIQTRTLELLDNIGLIQAFLNVGHPCDGIQFHVDGKVLVKISLDKLDSYYHFLLALPQSETERLLNERLVELKHEVERPIELHSLQQQEQTITCSLQNSSGQLETIDCDWLIACDGAKSSVRQFCNIDFPGEDLSEQFMVANAEMRTLLSTNNLHGFLNKGTMFLAVPFGAENYRIAANLHQGPRKFLTEKEVKEIIQERAQGAYKIRSVSWISPFWIHGKIVKNMRLGSIFLAGDAAHIHSPAGGQGMNTGLQDAYNLAWKLALVVHGKAQPSLLNSYHEERYPIVRQIVKRAEGFTKFALLENPLLIFLRNLMFRILNQYVRYSAKIPMLLTQLSLSYKKSSIIDYTAKPSRKAPRPGDRAPDVLIQPSIRLYDYLKHPQHQVLLFAGLSPQASDIEKLQELQQALDKHYPDLIKTHAISRQPLDQLNNLIPDEGGLIHQRYRVKTVAFYLVRPDLYLAGYSPRLDLQYFENYLQLLSVTPPFKNGVVS